MGYASLFSDRQWQPQLLERKGSQALPVGQLKSIATAVEALWEGTELEPSPDVAKGSNNKSDREIPATNGHGAEEQGGVSGGWF